MGILLRVIFRLVFFVGSIILTPFYFIELLKVVRMFKLSDPIQFYFLIAFIASSLFFFIFSKEGGFFSIFEHEITHIFWGILFLKSPRRLLVEKNVGGEVEIYRGNFLIILAPYFFQTINFLLLPLYFFIKESYYFIFFIIFGIALGYHTSSTIKEFSLNQPDLKIVGILFSIVFLIFANIVTYGFLFSLVVGGWELAASFIKNGFRGMILFSSSLL